MSDVPIFPSGLYWIRTELPSSGLLRKARYAVLWLFPTGTFRYIVCSPGYTWFEASGRWRYGNGLIHCRGKSQSFTDDCSDNHENRPYTSAFTPSADGQAVVSVGATPHHYARLSPQQLGPLFTLDERTVPSRGQDFETRMWEIEQQLGLVPNEERTISSISICNGSTGVTIWHRIPPVIS